jgi:predicted DNA-binding WGR domain protein
MVGFPKVRARLSGCPSRVLDSFSWGKACELQIVLNEISVELEARDASVNCQRSWRVAAGRDLFGAWTAEVHFGRLGTRGRAMRHRFESEEETRSFVRARLRRRQSLVRRLGVRYRLVHASPAALTLVALAGFDAGPLQGAIAPEAGGPWSLVGGGEAALLIYPPGAPTIG